VLVVSLVPIVLVGRAARDLDLRRTQLWQVVASLVGVAGLALRYWEIQSLPFTWTENAYASVVWTSFGTHMVDYVAEVGETIVLTALLFKGPLEKKHFEDIEVNAFFWAFLVLAWLPFAGVFYGEGVR
jgi:heme/copper-type cytochrome/quinol oxidase subunit 3